MEEINIDYFNEVKKLSPGESRGIVYKLQKTKQPLAVNLKNYMSNEFAWEQNTYQILK